MSQEGVDGSMGSEIDAGLMELMGSDHGKRWIHNIFRRQFVATEVLIARFPALKGRLTVLEQHPAEGPPFTGLTLPGDYQLSRHLRRVTALRAAASGP